MTESIEQMAKVDLAESPRMIDRLPRFRTQSGVRLKLRLGWYVRYYDWSDEGGLDSQGHLARKRVQEWIAPRSITDEKELDRLQRELMTRVNARQRGEYRPPDRKHMTVNQFFETQFLPEVEKSLSRSTAKTYRNVWKTYCEDHFKSQPLVSYRTPAANHFLKDLITARQLSRNTVNLIRTVCSACFTYAINEGLIPEDRNPIHGVHLMKNGRKPNKRIPYTRREVAAVFEAIPTLKAKLLFSLVALNGMNPAEAAALKFSDFWNDGEGDLVTIQRNAPDGILQDEMKTDKRKRTIPVAPAVAELLAAYRKECANADGFLFPHPSHKVINAPEWAEYNIKPYAKEAMKAIGAKWHGLYPGRGSVGSTITNHMGTVAASGILGNDPSTIEGHYYVPEIDRRTIAEVQRQHDEALAELRCSKSSAQ